MALSFRVLFRDAVRDAVRDCVLEIMPSTVPAVVSSVVSSFVVSSAMQVAALELIVKGLENGREAAARLQQQEEIGPPKTDRGNEL